MSRSWYVFKKKTPPDGSSQKCCFSHLFSPLFVCYSIQLVKKNPSKVHGWGKWKFFTEQVCVRISGPAQTGTIVRCTCCIWDSISCCTLAIIMSWCEGVMIPSLSISLWVQKQRCVQTHKAPTQTVFKRLFFFQSHQNWLLPSSKKNLSLFHQHTAVSFGVCPRTHEQPFIHQADYYRLSWTTVIKFSV